MIEAETLLRGLQGGDVYLDSLRELDYPPDLEEWQRKIAKLSEIWEIARGTKGVSKELLEKRIVAVFFTHIWSGLISEFETMERAIDFTLDEQAKTPEASARYKTLLGFSRLAAGEVSSFDEGMTNLLTDLEGIIGGLTAFGYLMSMVELEGLNSRSVYSIEYDDHVMLSLSPKGLSPQEILVEIREDLEMVRRGGNRWSRNKPVRAYSWLFDPKKKKTEKYLNWLEIGPANGAKIIEPQENDWDAVMASAKAIPLSGANLARFFQHGTLAKVWILEMNGEGFWR